MDIPPARSLTSPLKAGPLLHKAGGRAFPYLPHPWRRKHAVLAKGCLFLYDRPDAKGGDKGSGAFNLQFYDQVTEALTKETKKATHAFALQASDKTFADQGRYIFAADSAKEMHDWIRNLKKSIEHIRTNNRTNSDGVEETNPEEAAAETLITSDSTSKSKLEEETQTSDSTSKLTLEETSKLKLEETPKKNLATTVEEVVDKPKEKKSPGLLQNTDKKMSEDGFWILEESFDLLQNTDAKVPEEGKSVEKHSKNTDKKIVSKSNPTSAENSLTRKSSTDTKMKKEQAALISKSLRKMSKDSANSTENIDAANRSGESKKRKAVEDIEEELMSPNHLTTPTKLESMTKHRSRGPSGRRMPQNRRTIMMQHRTSSLTALAHGKEGAGQDNAINRSENGQDNGVSRSEGGQSDLRKEIADACDAPSKKPICPSLIIEDVTCSPDIETVDEFNDIESDLFFKPVINDDDQSGNNIEMRDSFIRDDTRSGKKPERNKSFYERMRTSLLASFRRRKVRPESSEVAESKEASPIANGDSLDAEHSKKSSRCTIL